MDGARTACGSVLKIVSTIVCTVINRISAGYHLLLRAVGPEIDDGPPSNHIVVWALLVFWFFLSLGGLALKFPTATFRICFTVISSCLTTVLIFCVMIDFIRGTYVVVQLC